MTRVLPGLIAALALSALTACAPSMTPQEVAERDCAAQGGQMQRVGRAQTLQCVIAYPDAGKTCRDGDDCLGDCRVGGGVIVEAGRPVQGQCSATSDRFGCYTTIEDGRAQAAICVD